MSKISRLFKPLDYLRIKHSEKIWYDLWIPLICSIISFFILFFLPKPIQIFGTNGLIKIFTGLLQILTGFYIASLAAVATFNKDGMDQEMSGDPPTLKIIYRGKYQIDKLTRRKFLCLLFGYLSLLSLILYFIGEGSNLIIDNIKFLFPVQAHIYIKWSFIWIFLLLSFNLFISTLLGLFYMAHRIHKHDPILMTSEIDDDSEDD